MPAAEPVTPAAVLSAATRPDAEAMLRECCGSARWAQLVAAGCPYRTTEELLAGAERAFDALGPDDWRAAFAAHARIGEPRTDDPRGQAEQAGAAGAQRSERAALRDGNRAYEQRFGHVFLICASGLSAGEMLAALHTRLTHTAEQELAIAAGEQRKITALRLRALA